MLPTMTATKVRMCKLYPSDKIVKMIEVKKDDIFSLIPVDETDTHADPNKLWKATTDAYYPTSKHDDDFYKPVATVVVIDAGQRIPHAENLNNEMPSL